MSQSSDLDTLFKAKSIAIVGVSSDPQKIGSVILKNLQEGGFTGGIYLVNPKYKTLYDLPCYPDLRSIPDAIDCACIAIPATFVKQSITDAAAKQVHSVVIITAGFGEEGQQGKALEAELFTIARSAGIRILGPNCLGFMNLPDHINLSFAATSPEIGNIALISQSGAICTALLDLAEKDNLGFSYAISIGNKVDISEVDLLPYLLQDQNTKVIGAYLEDIHQGKTLLSTYAESLNGKPLVIIKPGTSEAGKRAIGSHTGAVTGSAITLKTAFAQKGIVEADTLEEFYSLLQCFSLCKPLVGSNIAILTNAGGPGILATDKIVQAGLSLAAISEETKAKLRAFLPEEAALGNPIDILGDARADRFQQALDILNVDPNIDGILIVITPQYVTEIEETCKIIASISKTTTKTIIPILLGNFIVEKGKSVLRTTNTTYATEILTAVNTMKKMYFYEQKRVQVASSPMVQSPNVQPQQTENSPKIVLLSTKETLELATSYGIAQPEQQLCSDLPTALAWAKGKYPVALKVPTEVAAHKTELRGVILHIANDDTLSQAWQTLKQTFPGDISLLAQKQIDYEEEFFIGVSRDQDFGPLMVLGKGGIYTQEYHDYGYVLLPASRQELLEALSRTIISKILVGARGKAPLPVDQVLYTLERFQKLIFDHPEIVSLDLNPLLISKQSVSAVDIKIYRTAN